MRLLDARVARLENNAPKARNVITCLPLPNQSMASHCELLADGVYKHYSGYGKSIYYTSTELLNAYLQTQSHDKALVYSILSNEDVKAIIDEVEKNI